MKKQELIQRVSLILSAAGWTKAEIMAFFEQAHRLSFRSAEMAVDRALYSLKIAQDARSLVDEELRSAASVKPSSAVGERVDQLLRSDAGLTSAEAVSALTSYLTRGDKQAVSKLPNVSKKAFSIWVDKVAEVFGPSEVLHVATRIRNSRVHGKALDWGLRKHES